MKFVNIGFNNVVNKDRVISVVLPDSAPIKRLISLSKDKGLLIDASCGKSTKSVIITDSGYIVLSSCDINMIIKNLNDEKKGGE